MSKTSLFVSIIIPCRNEEKFIGKCLDSLALQDYPKDKLEILVVNGASNDGTKEVVENYAKRYPLIKLLENPQKFTPFGLNIGVKEAKGEIIIRMDAHAEYEKDYISKCVFYLMNSGADNVGGVIKTLPAKNTPEARAIALSLSIHFGVASDFRVGSREAKEVDTVFGGCFKKETFQKIGFFNEKLKRSQDLEFNLRLKRAGGKILLFPDIIIFYYPQETFKNFFKHNFDDGTWSIYPLKIIKIKFKLRHYLPLVLVGSLTFTFILGIFSSFFSTIFLLILFFYLLATFYFSLKITVREKDLRFLFLMPIAFFCRHFGYGLGSVWGLIKILKD